MNLPDLNEYRRSFEKNGIRYPLPTSPSHAGGLLEVLPPAPAEKTGWPWTEETRPQIYKVTDYWPKLTIVIPSFNQDDFIEITIRSILLQNYPNLELIIMDGGSTDSTPNTLSAYSPWLSFWKSAPDNGQGHAINLGFSLASGDFYAWINSDDYYLKDVFSMVISKFRSTRAAFIFGYAFEYNVKNNLYTLLRVPPIYDYFIKMPTLLQPSCFWNSKIHQPIWEELNCAMDYELWIRLLKGHSRYRYRQPLSVAQSHDAAKTSSPEMKNKWLEDHDKMWSPEGHGPVPEWNRVLLLHRLLMKIYRIFKWL